VSLTLTRYESGPDENSPVQEHPASWHIVSDRFEGADNGLALPEIIRTLRPPSGTAIPRTGGTLQTATPSLRILAPDPAPPPGYIAGGVPRGAAFNANVFQITSEPRMPEIRVRCDVRGIDLARTPIHWRLQCRHVLGRFEKVDSDGRYRATVLPLDEEWQGRSTATEFTLFARDRGPVSYDYNGVGRVMGGHAILTVAVLLPGGGRLQDVAHLRITGVNPTAEEIRAHAETLAGDRNVNIRHMIHALIWQESGGHQFAVEGGRPAAQTRTTYSFHRRPRQHRVQFDYPDDPPGFPLVAFDFGVGIMQYTKVNGQVVTPRIVWDWRENLRAGINLFLGEKMSAAYRHLRSSRQGGFTWRDWAYQGWGRYNGSWSRSSPQSPYSDHIRDHSPQYPLISTGRVPATTEAHPDTRALPEPDRLAPPPAWPPQPAPRP
jgi:hypothetical protein